MKIKAYFLFFMIILFIYFLLDFERDQKIDRFLNKQTELFSKLYEVHYHNFQKTSRMIYDSLVDQEKIFEIYQSLQSADENQKNLLRKELYSFLKAKYAQFQYTKLKQLHFHLKNNESFLRMHKPSKFGDNLTNIREGIAYVNKFKKQTHGFEMGRVYSGLRFVYPIIENDIHLGSVEISFDISSFGVEFMEHFKVLANFHLNGVILKKKAWEESIEENYIPSLIQGFYWEKRNTKVLNEFAKKLNISIEPPTLETINKALKVIDKKQTISLYDKKIDNVITFLPVLNSTTGEVVSFFSIRNFEPYIQSKNKNFYFVFTLATLFTILVFYIFLKEYRAKDNLNKILEEKVKEETIEINRQKNFFDTLIQTSPIPFFYKDIDGNYASVNQTWCDFTGFKKEEILGKSVYDVAPKEIADIYKEHDQKVFSLEENPQIYESKVVNKDSKEIYDVMFYKSAFINEHGKVEGIIGSLIDLTEIKNLQQDAMKKEKLLFEQSKLASMGEMIANIAHQWRQPLSVISTSATGMMAKQEFGMLSNEDIESNCNFINENAQFLSQTIEDFRNFIQHDKLKHDFNLKENIDKFLSLVSASVKNNNIELKIDIEDNLLLHGYSNEMIQCYLNIFNNSKDVFITNKQEEKLFFISAQKVQNNIVIIFKDNGGGIPKEVLSKVFEPYFTTKHKSQGTGLGLHMSYNIIVESMGGTINASNEKYTYNSKEYEGAKFTIEIPIV